MSILFYRMSIRYLYNYLNYSRASARKYHCIIDFVFLYSISCFIIEFSFLADKFYTLYVKGDDEMSAELQWVSSMAIGFSKKLMYLFQNMFIIGIFCYFINSNQENNDKYIDDSTTNDRNSNMIDSSKMQSLKFNQSLDVSLNELKELKSLTNSEIQVPRIIIESREEMLQT